MIEVKNLTKHYGNKVGVNNISFTVEKGEILGFLGPNGAGKSTTMNVITGYKPATRGSVTIGGFDIAEQPLKAKKMFGYLPEIPPLYPELRVRSYLKFVCELKGVPRAKRGPHIQDIMEGVKIADVKDRLIRNLTKGYRQRVCLAQALIADPEVLILDEPTAGLDPKQIVDIRKLIISLGKSHTIFLSSHILSEVSAVCNRVIIINKGEIAAIDTPENLSRNLTSTQSFIVKIKGRDELIAPVVQGIDGVLRAERQKDSGEGNGGFVTYLVEHVKSADVRTLLFLEMARLGCPIHEMKSVEFSLEEVFQQLTSDDKTAKEG